MTVFWSACDLSGLGGGNKLRPRTRYRRVPRRPVTGLVRESSSDSSHLFNCILRGNRTGSNSKKIPKFRPQIPAPYSHINIHNRGPSQAQAALFALEAVTHLFSVPPQRLIRSLCLTFDSAESSTIRPHHSSTSFGVSCRILTWFFQLLAGRGESSLLSICLDLHRLN